MIFYCSSLNVLKPIPTSNAVVKKGSRKDPFWDTARQNELIELVLKEAKLLQEQRRANEKICLTDVIKHILKKHQKYQNYSVRQIYNRVKDIERCTKDHNRKQLFQRIGSILDVPKKK